MLSKQTVLKSFTALSAGLILASASPLLVNQVEAADKIKINYWHVNADTQGGKTVNELVEAYNASQDEVEVVATFNPDMYKGLMQNLQAAVTSGETPDVVQVGWAFKDYFSENFEYTDPIQLVQEVDPDNKDFFEKNFLENVLNLAKKDDSYVGIPYSVSNPVLYINKDLLKEAGLDENGPQTWEQVQEFSKTIKEKTGKFGLYVQEPADSWAQQALLESNGAAIMTDGKASFASEEGIHAYQVYQDMVVKDESALHTTWEQGIQSFIDGNVAMLYTTIAQRNNVQSNANFAVTAIKSPTWEGKENKLPAGGAMLAVTSQDEEKKKATWDFLKYLYSVESMAKWTEGTGYVPPRKDVAEAENGLKKFLEENQMMTPAIEQMDAMVSWTSFPGDAGLEAEQMLLDMRDSILGGSDVAETLKSTQDAINDLF
ncbi:ABC transporter substrate-binding protein [Eremococcus coleocola]|uniref:ABC transporter, solute-binding protein n=1 Tax=Eremococcus coleocola ACS-139-V-Col8 TaxID=908337 RepID=E4KM87_9LACT|nr:ABC transporter substrate-binding protein [Eremococcus coleocola]EFR32013.1 ABC transporter, solute-binding protein [Eremococcus coleocola ACS-139-V-Col8]